jgi:hypothetical protein
MSGQYPPQQPYNNDNPQGPQYPQQPGQPPQGYPQQPAYTNPQYPQQPGQPPQGYPQQPPIYQQPMMQAPKKRAKWPWIAGGCGCLTVLAIIGIVIIASSTATVSNVASTAATAQTTTQPAATAAPASTGKWTTVQTYSGNGIKKTPVISVPADWQIAYTCKGIDVSGTTVDGVLVVTVTNSDNTPADVAVNATCKAGKTTSDVTEEHQAGQVFLDINSTSDWTIQVKEMK